MVGVRLYGQSAVVWSECGCMVGVWLYGWSAVVWLECGCMVGVRLIDSVPRHWRKQIFPLTAGINGRELVGEREDPRSQGRDSVWLELVEVCLGTASLEFICESILSVLESIRHCFLRVVHHLWL